MKKELDITRIMDDYTDNEFGIEGEQAVDTEKAVTDLLAQVQPKKKKMKPIFKVLIAAAAAVFVLAGAVVGSDLLSGSFTSGSGIEFKYEIDGEGNGFGYEAHLNYMDTLTVENDRLYLNVYDEAIDITDLCDRTTPYIHTYTNPGTGEDAYIIAVGTPVFYEFVDLFYVEGLGWIGNGCISGSGMDHIEVSVREFPELIDFEARDGYPPFLVDRYVEITYDNSHRHQGYRNENGEYVSFNDNDEIVPMLSETWQEDCLDAWLISALDQLELFV